MLVKYIIPEDGDELNHPNVFNLQSESATLNEIRKGFPVPGVFHFRFLKSLGNLNVWMDVVDAQTEIPVNNGTVFLKVSRPASGLPSVAASNPPATHEQPVVETAIPQPNRPPKPVKQTTENLIFDYNEQPVQSKTAPTATFEPLIPEDDLLGMSSSSSSAGKHQSNSQNDLFGLESLQPTKPVAMNGMNNSRGVSPMGGMSMSSTPMMQQHQPVNTSNRHGSVGGMGASMGNMGNGIGGGMGGQQKGFDPFDNLSGLGNSRPMGQQQYNSQQQSNFNNLNSSNRNNMNQNNRGRGY